MADSVTALVLAAGRGERLGGRPKAFLELRGETLLERAVALVRPFADQVIAGLPDDLLDAACRRLKDAEVELVAGGATRQDTVNRLLEHATGDLVLLHETARPFATPQLVERVLSACREHGAASCVMPLEVRDSLLLRDGFSLKCPIDRDQVVAQQTPQAYRRDWLVEASRQASEQGWTETSTSFLVHRAGYQIALVDGERDNIKLTYAEDWDHACRVISSDCDPEPAS